MERLLLSHRSHPAGDALPAALVPEEPRDPQAQVDEVRSLVEHHDDPGAERVAALPRVLERQLRVQEVRADEASGRPTEQDRLHGAAPAHAPGEVDQVAQGGSVLDLVHAGSLDLPRETEQPGARGAVGPERGIRPCPDPEDLQDVDQGLDVVDRRGPAEDPVRDRERRLVPRLAALALDRVEQGGLLAADVRAGAPAELDVERRPSAHDVLAEEAVVARLRDRVLEALGRQRVLPSDVDEAPLRATGVARDRQ